MNIVIILVRTYMCARRLHSLLVYIEAQHGFKVGRAFRDNRQEIYKPKILYIYIFHHCLIHYTPIVHLAGTLWLGHPNSTKVIHSMKKSNGMDDEKLVMD